MQSPVLCEMKLELWWFMVKARTTNSVMQDRWSSVMQNNYGTPELAIARGEGSYLYGVNGDKYLDLIGGIATNVLGHCHPAVTKAIMRQANTLGHTSNLYIHEPGLLLAEKLRELTEDSGAQIFFANSGAEVNEAALKLSRLTGRQEILATLGGFHGRTMGALSVTGQSSKREPFKPLVKRISFIPYNDLTSLAEALNDQVAAFIVEPIQGENGVIVPDENYLLEVRKLTKASGTLLIIDAVQTGMGRTGNWFGIDLAKVKPDIITLAKGLGGGLPLGAMIAFSSVKSKFSPGAHGSTFGGNPIAAAAALATINEITENELLHWALKIEKTIKLALENNSLVAQVRGQGALLGIVFRDPIARDIKASLQAAGILVALNSDYVIRLAPPLNLKIKEVEKFIKVLDEIERRGL
jgi:acetylornithine/N-succinyldiaminopimelate aminotransferase